MPLWALALNLAWEGIYAFLAITDRSGLSLQGIINMCWFGFDLGLAYTFFRFGRRYWTSGFPPAAFYAWGILAFLTAFIVQLAFLGEFSQSLAAQYSAFLQNLLMSVLFIGMFYARRGSEGQSRFIAVAKWIGTMAPTIVFGFMAQNTLITIVGLLCSVFDLLYIGILVWAKSHSISAAAISPPKVNQANL
jgi:hypothetical protein